jgi:NAD+ diphosphatase
MEDIKWVNKHDLHMAMAGLEDSFKAARPGSIAHFLLLNWLADTLQ